MKNQEKIELYEVELTAEDERGRYDYDYKTLDTNSWGINKKW